MGAPSSISASKAKNQFSALLGRVSRGDTVTITKRGKPVTVLAPIPFEESITPRKAAANILKSSTNA